MYMLDFAVVTPQSARVVEYYDDSCLSRTGIYKLKTFNMGYVYCVYCSTILHATHQLLETSSISSEVSHYSMEN